ncbi:magnesium transporter [Candidatus Bathyarchaeota archaeon]|nr:magnesium transporter [Candidatus Bathyarchaeota archaeon]
MAPVNDQFKSFTKTLRESLFAYFFDVGGIFAGAIVASQLSIMQFSPWIIAIYPAVLSAKGMIGGLLSGRLSTALHIGTIYPKLFGNTKSFYKLYQAIIALTLITSLTISMVSIIFGNQFWGINFSDFYDIVTVVLATMSMGLAFTLVSTIVAFVTFKKGLDPDILVYPIMSTVADLGITTCYVLVLNLFFLYDQTGKEVVLAIGIFQIILVLWILARNVHDREFSKTIKESLLTIFLVAFIVNITGTILNRINEIVEGRKEIYTVYPALIDTIGDVGSVIGSTATTKIALGLIGSSFKFMKHHAPQILGAWISSAIMFMFFSALSLIINNMLTLDMFLRFSYILLASNIIAVIAISIVSLTISVITYKRGLDPDNFVVPIESSLADTITSVALFIVLLLAG